MEKATEIIYKALKINGQKDMSKEVLHGELCAISRQISEEKVYGVVSLFKSKRLALYTVLLSITW